MKQDLEKVKENNIKFNKNKMQFKVNKVKYLGHIFSQEGMRPDDDRVMAVFDYETPKCVKDLQRFLGLVNYVGNFIPNLADVTTPLSDLLK